MGHQRLRPRVRWLSAARRTRGRPARSAPDLPGRDGRLHDLVVARRLRVVRGVADRRTRVSGPRCCGDRAGSALDSLRDLSRGPRAQHRARRLGCSRRLRSRCGRAARRRADVGSQLVVDLLRERPDRSGGVHPHADFAAGEPGRVGQVVRRARCDPRDLRALVARVRDHARRRGRLAVCEGTLVLRGVGDPAGRVRRVGVTSLRAVDAHRDFANQDGHRRKCRRLHSRDGDVLALPDVDALHAAGAGLRADEDRRRLPAGCRRRDLHVGDRSAARDAHRRQARVADRHGVADARARVFHPGVGRRVVRR